MCVSVCDDMEEEEEEEEEGGGGWRGRGLTEYPFECHVP